MVKSFLNPLKKNLKQKFCLNFKPGLQFLREISNLVFRNLKVVLEFALNESPHHKGMYIYYGKEH